MPRDEPKYFHAGAKFSIYTWDHATINIYGRCDYYISSKTHMVNFVNASAALEQLRQKALETKQLGPNVLVTGQSHSGKSTLCKILINYALKLGWTPILADLDLNKNMIAPPGNIAAAQVELPLPNDEIKS